MRESTASPSDLRHSDCQSSSSQELKSVYLTRAMLQEVGILPTLVYFHPKGCLDVFFVYPKGLFGRNFFMMRLPCFDPTLNLQFGTSFRWRNIWNLGLCSS